MFNLFKNKKDTHRPIKLNLADIAEINAKGKKLVLLCPTTLKKDQREFLMADFDSALSDSTRKTIILDGGFKIAVIDI